MRHPVPINLSVLASGGIYDPATDTWTTMPSQNAPGRRKGHTMIWTGDPASANALIVWGGSSLQGDGAVFRP